MVEERRYSLALQRKKALGEVRHELELAKTTARVQIHRHNGICGQVG